MNAFIIALKELATGLDVFVKRAEPWGIMLAVLGLGVSIYQFGEEREERRETRQFVAEERDARSWERLFATGSGEGGRTQALNHLASRYRVLWNTNLSCERNGGTIVERFYRKECSDPFIFSDIRAENLIFDAPKFDGMVFDCQEFNGYCNIVRYFVIKGGDVRYSKFRKMAGEHFSIYESDLSYSIFYLKYRYAEFRYVNLYNTIIENPVAGYYGSRKRFYEDYVDYAMVQNGIKISENRTIFEPSNARGRLGYWPVLGIFGANISGLKIEVPYFRDRQGNVEVSGAIHDSWFWEDKPPRFDPYVVVIEGTEVCPAQLRPDGVDDAARAKRPDSGCMSIEEYENQKCPKFGIYWGHVEHHADWPYLCRYEPEWQRKGPLFLNPNPSPRSIPVGGGSPLVPVVPRELDANGDFVRRFSDDDEQQMPVDTDFPNLIDQSTPKVDP